MNAAAIPPLLLGVVLGTALQLQQPQLWEAWTYGALVAAGGCGLVLQLVLRRRTHQLPVLLCAAALCAGATGLRAIAFSADRLQPALEGRDLVVTGIVAAMPQRNEAGVRFRLRVESARAGDVAVSLPPKLLLGWYGNAESTQLREPPIALAPGERWRFAVRLKAPHGHANPYGFDYELWLWEQGVQATGYVRAGARDPPPQRLDATWRHPVEQLRHRTRDAIYARVGDPRLAGVLAALVAGDQGAIERADWDVFRATGVAHLMSISGLHVTMFAWAAALALGAAWRRSAVLCLAWPAQHAALVGGLVLATSYAVFSGWGVPAQRTVWMLAAVAVLRLGARDWPWPWVWLLACATVVAIDPWALTQAGFWLSFVAVGVLFASDDARRRERASASPGPWRRFAAAAAGLLREQWVVTLALTPLSLLLFGQVSGIGLFANLVAIPWVTLVVTPLGLLGTLVPALWNVAAQAVALLSAGLQVLAGLPFATWSAPAPPLWAGAAGVLGGLLLVMRLPRTARALGLPLLLPVLLWQAPRPVPGEFEVLAADVGQGNAVLVRTATHTLVYDTGPGYSRETDAGQRVLVPLLRAFGERVDTVVLSHGDQDHVGGAVAVLRMQPQAALLASLPADHVLRTLRPGPRCEAGRQWSWDGVHFRVLHPPTEAWLAPSRPNTLSCVLHVSNGRSAALLPGDIEKAQEATLAADPDAVRADLLLVPHHGSKTSSSPALLAAVRPWVAVVQAGYRNRFGHPAAEVVERYRLLGIRLEASFGCGAASWRSERPAVVRCERTAAQRYWHHGAAAHPAPQGE